MYHETHCGCGEHGKHHGEQHGQEIHGGDCGCGGHGGESGGMHHGGGCRCGCRQRHGGMGFHRRFVSREEIVSHLEEYLRQLQAEAKGVEERIAELKKES